MSGSCCDDPDLEVWICYQTYSLYECNNCGSVVDNLNRGGA